MFLINCSLLEGMERSLGEFYVQLTRPWTRTWGSKISLKSFPELPAGGLHASGTTSLTAEATLIIRRARACRLPSLRHRGNEQAMTCSFVQLPGVEASTRPCPPALPRGPPGCVCGTHGGPPSSLGNTGCAKKSCAGRKLWCL